MSKLKVGILYGGRSVEHAVSVNSAKNIFEFIDRSRFQPVAIGISQQGQWYKKEVVDKDIEQGIPLSLQLNTKDPKFSFSGGDINPDIIFPLLHGTGGEDGSVQGLLQAMGIPCVGSGVLGSALSMNKIVAKQLLQQAGVPIGKFLAFNKSEKSKIQFSDIVNILGLPFMCKSASLGSSVGVSKVKNAQDFVKAIDDSFQYDDEILFEEFITGREIECAILGNNPPVASLPGEIVINPQYEFYTFDAKYVDPNAVKIEVPAKLSRETATEIQALSIRAYQTLRCLDYARVDLFFSADNKIYINEINTIPGFTNSSMFPMMWKERGIPFTELITKLVETALSRHQDTSAVIRNFQSALKY